MTWDDSGIKLIKHQINEIAKLRTMTNVFGHQMQGHVEEIERLRKSHAELLAAAKASIALADSNVQLDDDGKPLRTPECKKIYDRVVVSIAKAEEINK